MMENTPRCKKPMTKDEIAFFVDLIQKNPNITSKETNAATNKLKEDAWNSLTAAYNAKWWPYPRHKEQLKLKWDNMKKAARKRAKEKRTNSLKIGNGRLNYITPDEVLDKVIALMSSRYGSEVAGGDGEQVNSDNDSAETPCDVILTGTSGGVKKRRLDVTCSEDMANCNGGSNHSLAMPTMMKFLQNKRKKNPQLDHGRSRCYSAIAKYYEKKAEKVDVEIKLLKLELADKERNYVVNNL